jgi:chromosome segregation ATPase
MSLSDVLVAAVSILGSGGFAGAIGGAIQARAREGQETATAERLKAESEARTAQAVADALSHARADLNDAKKLYDEAIHNERACHQRVEDLRREGETQRAECDRRVEELARKVERLGTTIRPPAHT